MVTEVGPPGSARSRPRRPRARGQPASRDLRSRSRGSCRRRRVRPPRRPAWARGAVRCRVPRGSLRPPRRGDRRVAGRSGSGNTMQRGSHSGSNFWLNDRSDSIWKNGFSLRTHQVANFCTGVCWISGSSIRPHAAKFIESRITPRSRSAGGGVRDEELRHAVRRVGIVAHEVERVAEVLRRTPGTTRRKPPGLPCSSTRDAQQELGVLALHVLAERHREPVLGVLAPPPGADLVQLRRPARAVRSTRRTSRNW